LFPLALSSSKKSILSPLTPSSSYTYPSGPEIVTTLPPKSFTFLTTPQATFPKPDTVTILPLMLSPLVLSISSAKYTTPKPVASGLINEPPKERPFPVNTPVNSFLNLLYCPNM
jgi:hypothetical protein